MTEEDTFNALRKMPFNELLELWQFHPEHKGDWEIHKVWHGWTWGEFCVVIGRHAEIHAPVI